MEERKEVRGGEDEKKEPIAKIYEEELRRIIKGIGYNEYKKNIRKIRRNTGYHIEYKGKIVWMQSSMLSGSIVLPTRKDAMNWIEKFFKTNK